MTNSLLGKRYAQAFFEHAQEFKNAQSVFDDFKLILAVINDSQDFRNFLRDPFITKDNRKEVFDAAFKKSCSQETLKYLTFLEKRDRINILEDVCIQFAILFNKHEGILPVNVISNADLKNKDILSITEHLQKKFKKQIQAEFAVDSTLIAGIKVNVSDTVYDYSISSQLERMKHQFIHG